MHENIRRNRFLILPPQVRDYIALTKPRIMSLLLFSGIAGAFLASRGVPSANEIVAVLLGGALASGGAAALNMYLEKDLDIRMGRTRSRPVAEGRIPPRNALIFGLTLNLLSFVSIILLTNWLAAILAILGSILYIGLYTILLKKTTTQNIVIGGVAGSMPPLVGYAAVAGTLTLEAWYLAVIIFFWTPPHFWALALMIKEDYARANVPMLPVIRGEDFTRLQILLYSVLLAGPVIALTFVSQELSSLYFGGAIAASVALIWFSVKLWRGKTKTEAWKLYRFSLLYLFLLFTLVIVDSSVS